MSPSLKYALLQISLARGAMARAQTSNADDCCRRATDALDSLQLEVEDLEKQNDELRQQLAVYGV